MITTMITKPNIKDIMSKRQYFMGQEILWLTQFAGKPYFWMKDGDGVVYLTKAKEHITGESYGADGTVMPVVSGLVPDFS